jgi:MFS family permease
MALSGVGMMAQTASINTYIQTHAAPGMRARAISYYIMAYQGIIPIGSLLTGVAAQYLGPRLTVFLAGICGTVATAIFVNYRKKQFPPVADSSSKPATGSVFS